MSKIANPNLDFPSQSVGFLKKWLALIDYKLVANAHRSARLGRSLRSLARLAQNRARLARSLRSLARPILCAPCDQFIIDQASHFFKKPRTGRDGFRRHISVARKQFCLPRVRAFSNFLKSFCASARSLMRRRLRDGLARFARYDHRSPAATHSSLARTKTF